MKNLLKPLLFIAITLIIIVGGTLIYQKFTSEPIPLSGPSQPEEPEIISKLTEEQAKTRAFDFLRSINFDATLSELKKFDELRTYAISHSHNLSAEYKFAIGEIIEEERSRRATKGYISINAFTGKIHNFSNSVPNRTGDKIDKSVAINKVIDFAKKNQTDLKDTEFHLTGDRIITNYSGTLNAYSFIWEKVDSKTQIRLPHYVSVNIGINGEMLSYVDDFLPVEISLIPKISQEKVEKIALNDFGKRFNLDKNLFTVAGGALLSVGSDPPEQVGASQTLVWEIELNIDWEKDFDLGEVGTIGGRYLVDAYTGKILSAKSMGIPIPDMTGLPR